MYETAKEQEEKTRELKEQKRKKASIINTIILLLIIAGLCTFIYIKRDDIFKSKDVDTKEEVKPEEKKEEEKPEEKKEEAKDYKSQTGELNAEKKSDEVNITLNGKSLKLSYKFEENEGPGQQILKINNTDVYNEEAMDSIYNLRYETFKATDNKEYLFVSYDLWGMFGFIIDDNAKILKKIESYDEELECFILAEKNTPVIEINNGEVYYYSYVPGSYGTDSTPDDYSLKLKQNKITINNSKIAESSTNKVISGTAAQCS